MKLVIIFSLLVLLTGNSFAQEFKSDTLSVLSKEVSSIQNLQYKFDEFELYCELNYMKFKLPSISDSSTVWMWTKLAINNSANPDFHIGGSTQNWIEPLHQQFLEDSKFNPVRYVLGMAQTAAVGYMLYRHIKKYGLFK